MAANASSKTVVGVIGSVYDKRVVGDEKRSVINFSIATAIRGREGDKWVDKATVWTNCIAWGRIADNIEKSFRKGDRVIAYGHEDVQKGYTKDDGTEVPDRIQLVVENIGVEVTWDPAHSEREVRDENDGGSRRSSSGSAGDTRKKPAPKKKQDDDFDDFDDFDDDDDDDLAF